MKKNKLVLSIGIVLALLGTWLMPLQAQNTKVKTLTVETHTGKYAGTTFYTNSHALLVGVNKFQHLPKNNWLEFSTRDVLSLREVLIQRYGFLPENIIVLLDEQATLENIRKALGYLSNKERVKATDRLLIYFSTHGQSVNLQNGGKEGFLIPYDAKIDLNRPGDLAGYYGTCLPMSSLWAYVESSPARHSLLLTDACFSGLLARSKGGRLGETTLQKYLSLPAYQVITAGGQGEEAEEDSKLGQSYFTYCLVTDLKERAREKCAAFSVAQMFGDLKTEVTEKSRGLQTPLMANYGGTEGEFVFVAMPSQPVPPLVSGLPKEADTGVFQPKRALAVNLGNKAAVALILGDKRESERLWRRAFEEDASYSLALSNIGMSYTEKGDVDESDKWFRKALTINPNDGQAYIGLFIVSRAHGEAKTTGVTMLQKAAEVEPDNANMLNSISGFYLSILGDATAAERVSKQAVQSDPKNGLACTTLGSVYLSLKRQEEAEIWYNKAVEVDPKNVGALTIAGQYFVSTRKFERGESLLLQANGYDPQELTSYYCMGISKVLQNDLKAAEGWCRKGLAIRTKGRCAADLYVLLASLRLGQGDRDEAHELALKAKEAEKDFPVLNKILSLKLYKELNL